MKTIDKINTDLVEYSNSLTDKKQVLAEIASLVAEKGNVGSVTEEQIHKALLEREKLGSTGFGHGVAIPHCRISSMERYAIGLLVSGKGIDFDSIDGEDVRIIPFVVGPEENPKEYLKLLSAISQMLRKKDFRKQLLQVQDTVQLQDLIMSQSYGEDETPPRRPGMKMMHVFVQNEDIFDDLLQVFAASESISALVVETHESTDFLMKSPLFAGFWNTDIRRFNRLIIAVINDKLVNSIVRNIEYICGKLSQRDDILLTVTDLHYVLGSLGE